MERRCSVKRVLRVLRMRLTLLSDSKHAGYLPSHLKNIKQPNKTRSKDAGKMCSLGCHAYQYANRGHQQDNTQSNTWLRLSLHGKTDSRNDPDLLIKSSEVLLAQQIHTLVMLCVGWRDVRHQEGLERGSWCCKLFADCKKQKLGVPHCVCWCGGCMSLARLASG